MNLLFECTNGWLSIHTWSHFKAENVAGAIVPYVAMKSSTDDITAFKAIVSSRYPAFHAIVIALLLCLPKPQWCASELNEGIQWMYMLVCVNLSRKGFKLGDRKITGQFLAHLCHDKEHVNFDSHQKGRYGGNIEMCFLDVSTFFLCRLQEKGDLVKKFEN